MAAEWLRADQVAAETAGHHEVLTTFTDLTGRTNTLREGDCVKCGARWPCLAAQWAAQDGRWRALVGALLAAAADGEAVKLSYVHGTWYSALSLRFQGVLAMAQAALDGAPPPTRGPAAE